LHKEQAPDRNKEWKNISFVLCSSKFLTQKPNESDVLLRRYFEVICQNSQTCAFPMATVFKLLSEHSPGSYAVFNNFIC